MNYATDKESLGQVLTTGKKQKGKQNKNPQKNWETKNPGRQKKECVMICINSSNTLSWPDLNERTDLWNITVNGLVMDLLIENQGILLD